MKRQQMILATACTSLLTAGLSLAGSFSTADLDGGYGFLLTSQTDFAGEALVTVSIGELTFDGVGGVTGVRNVTAETVSTSLVLGLRDATAEWSDTITGSYTVDADGTGTMSLEYPTQHTLEGPGTPITFPRREQYRLVLRDGGRKLYLTGLVRAEVVVHLVPYQHLILAGEAEQQSATCGEPASLQVTAPEQRDRLGRERP